MRELDGSILSPYDFECQPRRGAEGFVDIGADEFGQAINVRLWQEVTR